MFDKFLEFIKDGENLVFVLSVLAVVIVVVLFIVIGKIAKLNRKIKKQAKKFLDYEEKDITPLIEESKAEEVQEEAVVEEVQEEPVVEEAQEETVVEEVQEEVVVEEVQEEAVVEEVQEEAVVEEVQEEVVVEEVQEEAVVEEVKEEPVVEEVQEEVVVEEVQEEVVVEEGQEETVVEEVQEEVVSEEVQEETVVEEVQEEAVVEEVQEEVVVEEVQEVVVEEVQEETVVEEVQEEVVVEEVEEETVVEEIQEEAVVEEVQEVVVEEVQEETVVEEAQEEVVVEEIQEEPVVEEVEETVVEEVKEEAVVEKVKEEPVVKEKVVKKSKPKRSLPSPEEATIISEPKKRVYRGKYEVYATGDGYAYTLKASNGEILVQSEIYSSKEGVYKAIDAIKRNVENGDIRIFADKRGRYKFKVISKNYRVLAIGANYQTEKRAQSAVESFKKFALISEIVEVELEDKEYMVATPIVVIAEPKEGGKYFIEKFDSEYSWMLKANNGEILCQADGYTSRNGCAFAIEKFKNNVENGEFKYVKDKSGAYCYKLYNQSGRVCAVGESCPTKQGAISQAKSVKSFYHTTEIIEPTK